jgi:hypothetical protein
MRRAWRMGRQFSWQNHITHPLCQPHRGHYILQAVCLLPTVQHKGAKDALESACGACTAGVCTAVVVAGRLPSHLSFSSLAVSLLIISCDSSARSCMHNKWQVCTAIAKTQEGVQCAHAVERTHAHGEVVAHMSTT